MKFKSHILISYDCSYRSLDSLTERNRTSQRTYTKIRKALEQCGPVRGLQGSVYVVSSVDPYDDAVRKIAERLRLDVPDFMTICESLYFGDASDLIEGKELIRSEEQWQSDEGIGPWEPRTLPKASSRDVSNKADSISGTWEPRILPNASRRHVSNKSDSLGGAA